MVNHSFPPARQVVSLAVVAAVFCSTSQAVPPSVSDISKYQSIALKDGDGNKALQLSPSVFGGDQYVLASNLESNFHQSSAAPFRGDEYPLHPIYGNELRPFDGTDYSGNVAITSSSRELGTSDSNLSSKAGIDAAASNPNFEIQNSIYHTKPNPSDVMLGVAMQTAINNTANFTNLINELDSWQTCVAGLAQDEVFNENIIDRSHRDPSGPYVIKLLEDGETKHAASDVGFTDKNGDGFVVIDVTIEDASGEWKMDNLDVIIDAPAGLTAIFRVAGVSNTRVSDGSIQIGEGGIAADNFGAIFYKGDSEDGYSGQNLFNLSGSVLDGIAYWELNKRTSEIGKNVISLSNTQGAAKFIVPQVR